MTPEQYLAARALVDRLLPHLNAADPLVAIGALLALCQAVVDQHPAYSAEAAHAFFAAAFALGATPSFSSRPIGAPLH